MHLMNQTQMSLVVSILHPASDQVVQRCAATHRACPLAMSLDGALEGHSGFDLLCRQLLQAGLILFPQVLQFGVMRRSFRLCGVLKIALSRVFTRGRAVAARFSFCNAEPTVLQGLALSPGWKTPMGSPSSP